MAAIGSPNAAVTNRLLRYFARGLADGLMLVACRIRCGSTPTMNPKRT
jgi:hypothetical protein